MTKARVNADNASADIQGVTAGTGLTGGGTSGTVTLTNDMATAIDSKGDLVVGTGADTYDNLAVGSNGDTIVADSSTATGLKWAAPSTGAESLGFTAGKNKILNGDFSINQRGLTSTTLQGYGFDRWNSGNSGGTVTYSAQTFTPGTAPVTGYEAANFARLVTSGQSGAGDFAYLFQRIEDVRSFANQTITVSLWAKASTGTPQVGISIEQFFGTGGSSAVITSTTPVTISTSWARYSVTVAIPSLSGKTIGTGSSLGIGVMTSAGTTISAAGYPAVGVQNATIDFWGVQAEAGSTATAFQTATGTIQGELAACQRYYYRSTGDTSLYNSYGTGSAQSTTTAFVLFKMPVTMRVEPTSLDYSGLAVYDGVTVSAVSSATLSAGNSGKDIAWIDTVSTGLTALRSYTTLNNNNSTAYIGVSAEL